jgi:hypothetical protein
MFVDRDLPNRLVGERDVRRLFLDHPTEVWGGHVQTFARSAEPKVLSA